MKLSWLIRMPKPGESKMVTSLPNPVSCPSTRAVSKKVSGNYVTIHRLLLAETGLDLPAVKKLVGE